MSKGNSADRGYTTAWKKLRLAAIARYGATCYLCGDPIDLTIKDNKSPKMYSLDHLDPIKHFGVAVPNLDRVRPTHKGCNSRRGPGRKQRPQSRRW